ncbi:STAS domain-containing protein [Verrucomicrobium spinosum]|uniref:STAS domain-containing protein n=1 Tax=Verrucomicrobium spinosum TaxID=2736 RepID=UPI000174591E|nr:STAS domain-containing protein [Verrucomicrobium spinosum]
MTLESEILPDLTLAKLSGQVDTLTAAELEMKLGDLAEVTKRALLVDCSDLTYINSAGLRVFLIVAKKMETAGGLCAFCSLTPNVRLVFETIGFDRILKLYENRAVALEQIAPPQAQAA